MDTGNRTVYLRKTEYDTLGRVSAILRYYPQAGNIPLAQQTYHYNAAGELTRVGYGATIGTEYTYDSFGRLSVSELKNTYGDRLGAKDTYFYATHGSEGSLTRSSGQLRQLKKEERIGESVLTVFYTYTYDNAGNITSIEKAYEDGQVIARTSYVYDKAGQLLRENVWDGLASVSFTQCYSYSDSGNLLGRIKYAYTTGAVGTPLESVDYTYGDSGYGDLLTLVGGESIVYDAIGNPTTYRGASLAFTGRRLRSYAKNGTLTSYRYDADGIRTQKTAGNTRHEYESEGGKIYREQIFEDNTLQSDLRYFYDAAGRPAMLQVISGSGGSSVYYYGTNAQGDVIAMYDSDGNLCVSYLYDAWGNLLSSETYTNAGTTARSLNSLLYRGYYFDSETGFYYLQSRYYDPEVGRFLNADNIGYLGEGSNLTSYNLFAYCGNNPVTGYDPAGTLDWGNLFKGSGWLAVGVTAIAVGVSVLTCGVAAPAIMAVAAVTVAAGAATAVNGVSELGEAATGHNFMRDDVFRGNAKAYNTYAHTTAAVAEIGTMVCGGWLKANAPRIEAYNNVQNYTYADGAAKHVGERSYYDSTLLKKEIIKYGTMTNEGGGVYTFKAAGTAFSNVRQTFQSGIWELTTINGKGLIGHFLLRS